MGGSRVGQQDYQSARPDAGFILYTPRMPGDLAMRCWLEKRRRRLRLAFAESAIRGQGGPDTAAAAAAGDERIKADESLSEHRTTS